MVGPTLDSVSPCLFRRPFQMPTPCALNEIGFNALVHLCLFVKRLLSYWCKCFFFGARAT